MVIDDVEVVAVDVDRGEASVCCLAITFAETKFEYPVYKAPKRR